MTAMETLRETRLRWPVTAGLSWAAGWVAMSAAAQAGSPVMASVATGLAVSATPAFIGGALGIDTFWRRVFVVGGFPLLLLASGLGAGLPAWAWAVPLALLAAAYPVSAWRDAPVFPTPRDALAGLPAKLSLPAAPRLHDAGCGLGHGLQALRRAWPDAQVSGIERSWPWRLVAAVRCPWARVMQGDMWLASWAGLDAVYLFQRPESMARAMAKAEAEMAPGAWLLSLEFDVPGRTSDVTVRIGNDRPVLAYRIGGTPATEKPLKSMPDAPMNASWR
jgi:hypothetical protein